MVLSVFLAAKVVSSYGVVFGLSNLCVSRRAWHLTTLLFMSFMVELLGRINTPEFLLCGAELRWFMTAVSIIGVARRLSVVSSVGEKFLARRWSPPMEMTLVRTESVTLRVAPVLTERLTGVRRVLTCLRGSFSLVSRARIRVVCPWSFTTFIQVVGPRRTECR